MTKERWLLVMKILGAALVIWALVTLVSGLTLADVGPDIEGRTFFFEDTGIPGYGFIAAAGGVIGIVLYVVAQLMGRSKK